MDLEKQIGICSEIINLASKLYDSKLRNAIFKNVGDHRQDLRDLTYGIVKKNECACCEQLIDTTELIESDNGELICKDRVKCNKTYQEILNTI